MWSECLRLGVAAITYDPMTKIDLSAHPDYQPTRLWAQLEPTQHASLKRVAYDMRAGDTIYVKKGPMIVDKGIIRGTGNQRAYIFDSSFLLRDPSGTPWAHQVPVDWSGKFLGRRILLGAEQLTVKQLTPEDVRAIERATPLLRTAQTAPTEKEQQAALREEAYYRETPARLKVIIPRHNTLSNDFCRWLKRSYKINARQEVNQIDIHFQFRQQRVLAELKICFGVGTTKAIRESLGQILEYNHYPDREPREQWLIVLDEEPSVEDRNFIKILRERLSLPLAIGWQHQNGFSFFPQWP